MKNSKANILIESISKSIAKNGIDPESLVPQLKELRELAKQEDDPLVIRCIRMAYQHLENEDGWAYAVIRPDEDEEEEAETPAEPEEHSAEEHLDYLLTLWIKSDNVYNRDEMRRVANELQEL